MTWMWSIKIGYRLHKSLRREIKRKIRDKGQEYITESIERESVETEVGGITRAMNRAYNETESIEPTKEGLLRNKTW